MLLGVAYICCIPAPRSLCSQRITVLGLCGLAALGEKKSHHCEQLYEKKNNKKSNVKGGSSVLLYVLVICFLVHNKETNWRIVPSF